jgi:hypothetical protein
MFCSNLLLAAFENAEQIGIKKLITGDEFRFYLFYPDESA